jgi:hypothetical protein
MIVETITSFSCSTVMLKGSSWQETWVRLLGSLPLATQPNSDSPGHYGAELSEEIQAAVYSESDGVAK